jgi:hypothetical protein
MKTWKARVRKTYSSLEDLRNHNRIYGVVKRCGYRSAKKLWEDNPIIGGSVNPADFGLVKK